jgi:Domain of unknown function (DUF4219)
MKIKVGDNTMALQRGVWASHGAQPVFDGESYDYWSIKMKTLLISQDLWEIVEECYEVKVKPMMETVKEIKKEKVGTLASVEKK